MFKAANKDSSPPTSITPTPGGTTCLSSQAATLRLTPEGLNIVGGALAAGKLTSSLKDQQQKFFATRSADGNWNLLMTRPSDPSRLFLVKPAPGHKFQMTGGKVRMENMDSAGEINSAGESSTNGCEVDPPSQISSSETEEQTPGTSKSIAVPVAQLWTPSTVSPLSAPQTQAVSAANVQTTAATETAHPFSVPEKKRTFFKTAKDRRAQKAAAEQALGKKTHGKIRKGGRSPAATSKQVKGLKVLSSDSCQSQVSSKTRHSSATSTIQNSSPSSISEGGQVTLTFDSCLHMPSASSPSRDNTSTQQSHTENKTAGGEVCRNTVEKDTKSKLLNIGQCLGRAGFGPLEEGDIMVSVMKSYESLVTDEVAKAGEPSENHNDSQDEQINLKPCSTSDVGIHSPTDKGRSPQQNPCQNELEEDQPGRCSTNPSGSKDEKSPKSASTGLHSRKSIPNKSCERDRELNTSVEDDELTSDCKLPNSHKTVEKTSEMSKPRLDRRLQKTPEKNENSSFSSDTDDYEFVSSDSEKQSKTRGSNRKVSAQHHISATSSVPDRVSCDGFDTEDVEELQQNTTAQKEVQQNPKTQKAICNPTTQKTFAEKKQFHSSVDETFKRILNCGDSDSSSTHLTFKTFGETDSEQKCGSGKEDRKSDENVQDSSEDVEVPQSKQCSDPECVEECKTSSEPGAHCSSCSDDTSPGQTGEDVTDNAIIEGLTKICEVLAIARQGETYPENIKTSSTKVISETCHNHTQSARGRGEGCREVDQSIGDILQQKAPAENRSNTENSELKPEQNKPKKRKKRKSEVENLGAVVEADPRGTSEDAVVCKKSREQEPVSGMAIRRTSVLYSPKQGKKAHRKKRQVKFCINLNKGKLLEVANGEEAVNDVGSLASVSPSTQNTASSKLASDCETGNVSHCLSHAEQERSKSKENNIEPLPGENQVTSPQSTEPEHVCVPDIENQNEKNGQKCLTLLCPVENSKRKRKKKKLKSLVKTMASATSANADSCLPSDLNSLPKNHPDDSVTLSQTVTNAGIEVEKQTASVGSEPQKKKRKKRLNELETLIHDQEAYVVHDSKQSRKEMSDSKECTEDTAHETTEQEEMHSFDLTEVDKNDEQNEPGKADSCLSKRQECERTSLKVSESAEVVDDLASGNGAELPGSSADLPDAASEQKSNKKEESEQQPKKEKRKYKKRIKKFPNAGVIVMPPVVPCTDPDPMAIDCQEKEASENADLNSSFSTDVSNFNEPEKANDISNVTDSEDEEAKSNKAMAKFLTSRSFSKWELARMFGTPFVVLHRVSDLDIDFMSRRFRNARVSGRARCSTHCRLRTLDYLCALDLINCKPPPIPKKKASEVQKDAASDANEVLPPKKRNRKNKKGCEKDEDGKKRKRRRKHQKEQSSSGDGDVIIVDESSSKTPNTAASSQGTGTVTSSASSVPSFPSATFGRFRLKPIGPHAKSLVPCGVSSSQVTTTAGPRFIIPPVAANTGRTSSVHQIFTIPSFGSVSRPPSVPQVLTLSSLGNTISSANRILIPPLVVNSSSASLRDATRASLTQAISNSLCKTRLVTPCSGAPVVALTPSPVSAQPASVLQKAPIVVQTGAVTQPSSMLPKGPIIVTVAPPSAPVLGKAPQVVQSTIASSTAPATQGSAGAPKQFFVVQMGDKRVLVPAAALSSAATPSTTSSTPSGVTTVAATPRPLLQSSVHLSSVSVQQSASPAPAVITAPATAVRQQATSLVPGSMARIVLSNRPTITVSPTTGPTASTVLFASRPGVGGAGARPNQAWTGPRTVDSNRRVMVTPSPGSQPQGLRVVLSGTAAVNSATRFSVSSSRGGVVVASRQPNSLVRAASPRQSRPGKRVMTEEERLRKRARLEKKYPLPPGVVIKTEPQSRGYSDEGKTTQANSSARVFVSTVPSGSASRTQVNLTQPIPVLSAFRGSPIIIRQAVPANTSIPRPSSLLGPLIIRMPNASASTVTSGTSASCATSTVPAMAATSLLASSRVSNTAASTVPLRYSLLSGNAVVTAGSAPSSSVVVRPSASLVSPLTATQSRRAPSSVSVVNTSSAPSQTSSAPNGSVQAASDSQQNNSEDDAIYISDSPPPAPPASESAADSHSAPAAEKVPEVSSASLETTDVDSLSCASVTSATVSAAVAVSQIPTTVVYSSQSPIMVTSATPSTSSTSGPSSRMASLGAMWVRQAAASPSSMPTIDTRSLQSERMQRLKEMLAKQIENIGDERRQKALQALHQQFCQAVTAENAEDISPSVTARTDSNDQSASNSCELLDVDDPDLQHTETACGMEQTNQSSDQSVKVVESAGGASGEILDCAEGRTSVDRAEAEVRSDSAVLHTEVDSGDTDGVVESLSQQAAPPILEVDDASFLDGNMLMAVDEEEERAVLAMEFEGNSESADKPNSDGGEMSEGNGTHGQGETVPSGAVNNGRQTDNDTDNPAGISDSNLCPDETSECDKDMQDTSNNPEGNSDGDAPMAHAQDTDNVEMDSTEPSNDLR